MEKNEDRISALPDCLLQHILSFLPSTEDAILTGILSKRWKNQWTQVPVLIFDFYSGMFSDSDDSIDEYVESFESVDEEFARFIDNVLLQHDCSKIKKLQLAYNFKKDANFYEKIRFATRKHVEELILNCYPDPREPYVLPKLLLFDNASLVELEIINCYFTHDRSINSGSLKALTMEGTTCDMLTANFLSGSSSLEFLEVKPHGGYWYVIASKTLKTLIISGIRIDKHRDIKVSCPNLEELSFVSCILPGRVITNVVSGCPLLRSLEIIDCHFEKLVIASKSLRKLVLGDLNECCAIEISCPNLENFDSYDYNYETFESMNGPSQYEGFQEVKANEIFEQLQNVEELTMGSWFIKILADVEVGGLSYLWSKTKILTLLLCMGLILSNFLGLYVQFVVHQRSRD